MHALQPRGSEAPRARPAAGVASPAIIGVRLWGAIILRYMEWAENIGVVVGMAGALVGIAGAVVVSFWRGATFVQTITQAITASEERLRNENKLLGDKIEALKVDVAVLKTRQEDDRQRATRQEQLEVNAEVLVEGLMEHAR